MINTIYTKIKQLLPSIELAEAHTDEDSYTVFIPTSRDRRNKAGVYAIEADVEFYSVSPVFEVAETAMNTIISQIGTEMNDDVYTATITSQDKKSYEGLWVLQTIYRIIQNS